MISLLRIRIREAYGGCAPRVLDPFAGGGALPLEAMRLGCEAAAIDINPVAWFILKCTLDYPRRLAGATLPLPDVVRSDRNFMEAFLKAGDSRAGRSRGSSRTRPCHGPRSLLPPEGRGALPCSHPEPVTLARSSSVTH